MASSSAHFALGGPVPNSRSEVARPREPEADIAEGGFDGDAMQVRSCLALAFYCERWERCGPCDPNHGTVVGRGSSLARTLDDLLAHREDMNYDEDEEKDGDCPDAVSSGGAPSDPPETCASSDDDDDDSQPSELDTQDVFRRLEMQS